MTDSIAPETSAKTSFARRYLPALLVGVAAIGLIGYLASRSGLDKALLRQQLDDFAAHLHETAAKQGRDVTFTYTDVSIDGSFSHKHGVIHGPKLAIKPAEAKGDQEALIVSTPALEVYPKAADLSALEIQFPHPVDFTNESTPDKKLLTVKASEPLAFLVARSSEKDVEYLDFTHHTPARLDFTYLREHQVEGTEDATPTLVPVYQNLAVTFAPGGNIATHFSTDGKNHGTSSIDLHDIHMIPESVPNGEITIGEFTERTSNLVNEQGQTAASVKMHVGDITASPDFIPYAPIALNLDVTFEGAPTQTPEDVAAITKGQSALKLNDFTLSTKEAKLTAKADFATTQGDALPEGTANITLTNVPYVIKELSDNGILNDTNEGFVVPVLELTTGQKLPEIKDAVIDINRQKGGAFTIGKTTFEELFAVVLKNALVKSTQRPAMVPAPQIPATPDKKMPVKGLKVEEGARG